ncbi:MAG: hypothetical protein QRY74_05385 [Chlamydia sp.]
MTSLPRKVCGAHIEKVNDGDNSVINCTTAVINDLFNKAKRQKEIMERKYQKESIDNKKIEIGLIELTESAMSFQENQSTSNKIYQLQTIATCLKYIRNVLKESDYLIRYFNRINKIDSRIDKLNSEVVHVLDRLQDRSMDEVIIEIDRIVETHSIIADLWEIVDALENRKKTDRNQFKKYCTLDFILFSQ